MIIVGKDALKHVFDLLKAKLDTVKSAYTAAREAGYTGTEAEFSADLAAMQGLAEELKNL